MRRYTITDLPDRIELGRQTETGVENILFDCAGWFEQYGEMELTIWHVRPGEQAAYPAAATQDGSCVTWHVNDADTAIYGEGTVEVLGACEGMRKISGKCRTYIQASGLAKPGVMPEGAAPWVKEMLDDVKRAEEAAEAAGAGVEDIAAVLDITRINLVDTGMLAESFEYIGGGAASGYTWDEENGYVVCRVSLTQSGRVFFAGQRIAVAEGDVFTFSADVRFENSTNDKRVWFCIEDQYAPAGWYTIPAYAYGEWTRVYQTITIDAATAALGEARFCLNLQNTNMGPMHIRNIQVSRGTTAYPYVPYDTAESGRLMEYDNMRDKVDDMAEADGAFVYIANSRLPEISNSTTAGWLKVVIPDDVVYLGARYKSITIKQTSMLETLGTYAAAYGSAGVTVQLCYQRALVIDTKLGAILIRLCQGEIQPGDIVLLYNGWANPYGIFMQYALRGRVTDIENRLMASSDVYEWESAAREYAALFNNTDNAEGFLFFTDPHLSMGTGWEEQFEGYTQYIQKVYNSTPTAFCVCGGDWLGNSDTMDEACYKLGRINGTMRGLIGEYCPVLGNHDTNYQGRLNSDSANYTGTLTDATIRNLWFGRERAAYYRYECATAAMYVLDSGLESNVMTEYRWEQIDWMAQALRSEAAANIFIAMHMIYEGDGTLKTFADNVFALAGAYNARSSIVLNGTTHDFSGCTGRVRFAIAGHTHADSAGVLHGIPYVITTRTVQSNMPTFDMVLADWDAGIAHFVRVGDGESRDVAMA